MKIDATTSQEELLKLSEAVLKRDFLRSTPLNLRFFLRYVVLFLLFPGMVFGFRVGLGITIAFCALLVGILLWGGEAASAVAIYSWLGAGLLVLVCVSYGVLRKAWLERQQRRLFRPAQQGLRHAKIQPERCPLRWHAAGAEGFSAASLVLRVPARGVYAVLLTLREYSGAKIVTGGKTGTAVVHAEGGKGSDFHALTLYRLEAGCHELTWAVPMTGRQCPQAEVSLLNMPPAA